MGITIYMVALLFVMIVNFAGSFGVAAARIPDQRTIARAGSVHIALEHSARGVVLTNQRVAIIVEPCICRDPVCDAVEPAERAWVSVALLGFHSENDGHSRPSWFCWPG